MKQDKLSYYYNIYATFSTFDKLQHFKTVEKSKERFFLNMYFKNWQKYISNEDYNYLNELYNINKDRWEIVVLRLYYNYRYVFYQDKYFFLKKKYLCYLTYLYHLISNNMD